jgi:initiation factor 1A
MVKNSTGGNKTKGKARKNLTVKPSTSLRTSENDCEKYAQVTKMLGDGMCNVLCIDEETRLCNMRGKFTGRGKRDNFIVVGSWVLVGLRDWESKKSDKLEKCDLLEVYNDSEKDKLKNTITNVHWEIFNVNEKQYETDKHEENDIHFADANTQDYYDLLEQEIKLKNQSNKTNKSTIIDDDEIDINDI